MPLLSEDVQPGDESLSGHVPACPGCTLHTHPGTFRILRILWLHSPYTPVPYSGIPASLDKDSHTPRLACFCAGMPSLPGCIGSRTSVNDGSTSMLDGSTPVAE